MTMDTYIWLFPTLFMFHDMEEIMGLRGRLTKNEAVLAERFPKIAQLYMHFTTEGFAVAVFEELCVCILFCLLASLPWVFFKTKNSEIYATLRLNYTKRIAYLCPPKQRK